MIELPPNVPGFVIDTTDYAGNFERQMCAYLTGRTDRSVGVGAELADLYLEEVGNPDESVVDIPDDGGCLRPCSVYSSEGQTPCQGVVIFLESKREPAPEKIALWKARAAKFLTLDIPGLQKPKAIVGFRIVFRPQVPIRETVV